MGWLLSKPLSEFSPVEFKAHVRALFFKPPPRTKAKKPARAFSWKITKTGKLSVTLRRKPRWMSREEVAQIVVESGLPENEVWIKVFDAKAKNPIRLGTDADMKRLVVVEK